MFIAIASDHGGFKFKELLLEFLEKEGHDVTDCGCDDEKSCDYPDLAEKAIKLILAQEVDRAILICSTGIGMSMAGNQHKKIRAAVVYSNNTAKQSREHLDANVLCLGAKEFPEKDLIAFTKIWLNTPFSNEERHIRRLLKIG